MNMGNSYKAKDMLVREKRGKDVTPATISKLDTSGTVVDPQSTPVSAYTVKQKKYTGKNEATVGTISSATVNEYMGIDPERTSPRKFTKKTK